MQAQMHKKDKSPVIRCPRCHAENLAVQSRCGKCGYVFPTKGSFKGERKGENDNGMGDGMGAPVPPPIPGSGIGGGIENPDPPASDEPPKLTRPKHIPESGVSEGLVKSRGQWMSCPRCGADVKPDAKRCVRCGHRPG
jgi:ribosomal protein L40E